MDFHHLRYEMNVKIQSIVLVLTRTKLRKQFCHCARSISRRVRSRTWTAIRSLSYSTLSLGITRFWNFSNPLSGCKVTKFEGVKYWAQRAQYLLSNTFGIIAIAQTTQKQLNLTPLTPLRGVGGSKKFWGAKKFGETNFGDTLVLKFFKSVEKHKFAKQICVFQYSQLTIIAAMLQ